MSDIRFVARSFAVAVLLALCNVAVPPAAYAIDAETATHVGGDLTDLSKKLGVLEEAVSKVVDAGPHVVDELSKAFGRLAEANGPEAAAKNAWRGVLSLAFVVLLLYAMRALSAERRRRWIGDAVAARGAARLIAIEVLDLAVIALASYLLIEFVFNAGGNQDLLVVALLWGWVRWL